MFGDLAYFDLTRAEAADHLLRCEELEALAEQLASAVGLGGRDRKAPSNVERARVNVRRRLKDSIRRVGPPS